MKKFHFRPLPGLTLVTLVMLSILVALGTWQYQRLGWKTSVLQEIDRAANMAPISSLIEVNAIFHNNIPLDFRRIRIDASFLQAEPLRVYTPRESDYGWRLFVPVESSGYKTFAAMDVIKDGAEPIVYKGDRVLAGYVRVARDGKRRTKSTPDQNRWFGFNPMPETHNWAEPFPDLDVRYYLDVVPGETDAGKLPIKYPEVRNNHLEYMLTWYSLALILLVFYILMHQREGRIGWS